jgi:hypothetical protein
MPKKAPGPGLGITVTVQRCHRNQGSASVFLTKEKPATDFR